MKTYQFNDEESQVVLFHYGVKNYHEMASANYIRAVVCQRLGITPEQKITYDPAKKELYVEEGIILPNSKSETKSK